MLHPQDPGAPSGVLCGRGQGGGGRGLSHVLSDILDTPVSPELLPAIEGQIARRPRIWWPLRATRLLPLLCHPLGLPATKVLRLAVARLRPHLPPGRRAPVAAYLLPPLLLPAVQAILSAGRPQGRLCGTLPPRRLADAERCFRGTVAGRTGDTGVSAFLTVCGKRTRATAIQPALWSFYAYTDKHGQAA